MKNCMIVGVGIANLCPLVSRRRRDVIRRICLVAKPRGGGVGGGDEVCPLPKLREVRILLTPLMS